MDRPKKKKRPLYRPVVCVAALFLVFCGLILRLIFLQAEVGSQVEADASSRSVQVASSRGYIYDRNLKPLVNTQRVNTAAVLLPRPTEDVGAVNAALQVYRNAGVNADTVRTVGACVLFETECEIPDEAVLNVQTVERYGKNDLCRHLIGYLDTNGNGVSGIEKAFDRVLAQDGGTIGLRYTADAENRTLAGTGLTVENRNYDCKAGVVLTIDRDVQAAAEDALKKYEIQKGAVVVLNVKDSAILALASVPSYDLWNMESSLTDPALPFLNRALEAYPVGSVFKPFVAAAAVERGVSTAGFTCSGSLDVGSVLFSCFQRKAHGALDLDSAVCNSCNTYFIDLGARVGADRLLETAKAFGFGEELRLTGTLGSAAGNLPSETELRNPAALANFSFGQGALLASPLQLAAAYAALARGGVYKPPYLMKAIVDQDLHETAYYLPEDEGKAAQTSTCEIVCESLRRNMISGTGVLGQPANAAAAGKTATAQTGDYDENGVERLCTWFCGFAPFPEPCYAVVVFSEDGRSAAEACAPVFRAITERILRLPE